MRCSVCDGECPEGDVFCRHCGSPVAAPAPSRPGTTAVEVEPPQDPETVAAAAEAEAPGGDSAAQGATLAEAQGGRRCVKCSSPLAEGVRFCAECGTRQPEVAAAPANENRTVAERAEPAVSSNTAPDPGDGASSPPRVERSLGTSAGTAQRMLLPRFPFRLVWSPRKPWGVTTTLTAAEVGDLFTERMTRKANVLRQANNYFRRVGWGVQRNAISGDLTAECRPNGPVAVGFGKNQIHLDVSGDTIICRTPPAGVGKVKAEVAPGTYTTLFGLYAYPATVYSFDVVKAIKKADPGATIRYPWSPVRMVLLTAVLLLIIIAAASGGSNNASNTADIQPGQPTQSNQPAEGSGEAGEGNSTGGGGSTAQASPPKKKPLPAPSRTIKAHLEQLGDGDYSGAFALMAEAYRAANPGWIANREQGDPEVGIVGVGRPHYGGGGTARVYVRFYARDRSPSQGSDTQCRLFKGSVEMIEHGGIWRYEPSSNALTATVVPISACHA